MGCCFSRHKNSNEKEQPKEPQISKIVQAEIAESACPENPSTNENSNVKYTLNRSPTKVKKENADKGSESKSKTEDDKFFDFDTEAFKTVNINTTPETVENKNMNELTLITDGPKSSQVGSSFIDHSIVMPKYNDSDFDTANERLLETTKKDEKLLDDIENNDEMQAKKYWSFSSNSILSQNDVGKEEENNNNFIDVNGFNNKKYDFFYIEFFYFLVWNKEYLKTIFPDLNFVLIIEIDDEKSSLEKIELQKSGDDRYYPKKTSANDEAFTRIMKVLYKDSTPFDNSEYNTHKLTFTVLNYTCNKYIPLCVEEVFVSEKKSYEGVKIKFNLNLNLIQSTRKVGYINFNVAYKSEEFSKNEYFEQKEKIYKNFCSLENTVKFVEDPLLIYKYNYFPNYYIKMNGSEANKMKCNFSSIGDVQDTDFGGELQNESIPLNRLLELFEHSKQAYDFYMILRKIGDYVSNSEFNEEKSLKLKERILVKMKEILEIKNNDKYLISLIFVTLKKLFFKSKRDSRSKSLKSTTPKNEAEMRQKLSEAAKLQEINLGLMRNFLELSYDFLKEKNFPQEITISSLNYIYKHYEEVVQNFYLEGKKRLNSDEFFSNYLLNDIKYEIFIDLLERYPENPSCVQIVLHIINKTIKYRRDDCKEVINYVLMNLNYESIIVKILKNHDCNSFIMTNLMYFLYYIVDIYKKDIEVIFSGIDFTKLREIFCTFKHNGFEQIHETLLYIIKNILIKRFEKQPNQEEAVTDDEFREIIVTLTSALEFIKIKIHSYKDFFKLAPLLIHLLNYVYIICSMINGFSNKRKKICVERRVSELVIDVLSSLNERRMFISIDNSFKRFELISLNTKTMVFRALFHCLQLIKNLKESFPSTLNKVYAEKIYKVLKSIGDYDNIYNPDGINKDIEKSVKKEESKQIITGLNTLKDYYLRYKKQEHEFVGDFLSIIRSN